MAWRPSGTHPPIDTDELKIKHSAIGMTPTANRTKHDSILYKAMLVLCASIVLFNGAKAQEHSATTAVCWSLMPGAGQIYNHQAWKVPIIYGGFAVVGYFINYNYQKVSLFRNEYIYRTTHNDTPNLDEYANYPTSSIYSLYNSYNRDYQLSIIIAVGVYALNLVDAYVSGHLFDFKIDDDISMSFAPSITPTATGFHPTVGFQMQF